MDAAPAFPLRSGRPARRRGFTLLEIAIVLGVIGAVIGGIYVVAANVIEHNKVNTLKQQVQGIVDNVRHAYSNRMRFPMTDLSYGMAKSMNVMPQSMVDDGFSSFINIYNGPTHVVHYPTSDQDFGVSMLNVPAATCLALTSGQYGTAASVAAAGLIDVGNGTSSIGVSQTADGISITEAMNLCNGTSREVDMVYTLRGAN